MMRKSFLLFIAVVLIGTMCVTTTGCVDKKPSVNDSVPTDMAANDTAATDSTDALIAETPMPKAADELFDDFVFNFAANKKLQLRRIHFPLPVYTGGKVVRTIEQNQWKMEHFFMRQGYYTLILDNKKALKMVKDTTIKHVTIEKILFKQKRIRQYLFNRINGEWMLTSLNVVPLRLSPDASFLGFYERFAVDSAYQVKSMNDLVDFTAPNPDDDFSSIEGQITADQWPMFKPAIIPSGTLYNIVYGQKVPAGSQRILMVRGIANGLEIEMVFSPKQGQWKLMKFSS